MTTFYSFLLVSLVFISLLAVLGHDTFPAEAVFSIRATTPTPNPTPVQQVTVDVPDGKLPGEFDREPTAEDYLNGGLGGVDADCDGVRNIIDNCALNFNPDQKDSDKDGIGDVCDKLRKRKARESDISTSISRRDKRCDQDNDGVYDDKDNCPLFCNSDQRDVNKNRVGDACERLSSVRRICPPKR